MKKWFRRSALTLLTVLVFAGLVYHLGLRSWCLRWGTTPAEAYATFPGDNLFPIYTSEATHAITIHASPQQVWPWLMQIGQDRSGFYSYTFLENAFRCDMPKRERLAPNGRHELQAKRCGSVIRIDFPGKPAWSLLWCCRGNLS